MQPGRKCRLPAKCSDLAVELQERFLGQILGLRCVRSHPQTQRIHPPFVLVIERLERFRVPLLGPFNGLGLAEFGALSAVVARSSCLFRPHSLGCGISSLCCTVCSVSPPLLGVARSIIEFQNIREFLPIFGGTLRRPFADSSPPTKPLLLDACIGRLTPNTQTPAAPKSRNLPKLVAEPARPSVKRT